MKTSGVAGALVLAAVLCGCSQTEEVSHPAATAIPEKQSIWLSDYDAALKQAAAENKYILLSFSGMQWCHYCQALENEVFSKPEFIDYAKNNLVCVQLDFDFSGRATNRELAAQHEALQTRFMVDGFPTVIILNLQGRAIARDGYRPDGPLAYVEMIKEIVASAPVK